MIKELLREGFILKSKKWYKNAIEIFYKVLELDNTSSELMLEIADCYYLMNEEERALNYIEQSLQNNPTHIESLKLLKHIFESKHAWQEAEQTAKNIYCISKKPEDLAEIFKLLNKQRKYQEIFEYQSDDKDYTLYYEKALAYFYLNNFELAEKYINLSIEQKKENKNLLLKGKILFKMNRKNECITLANNIDSQDLDAETLHFLGIVKQYECDFKSALKYLLKAVKLEPQNDLYLYDCASTYFKMEDIPQAKKYYNLAITLNPDNQNYHFALANLYYSEKNYKRAMEELHYDFFEAKLLKAIILFDSGYLALAKKEFENLLKEQPTNERILAYKTKITEKLKV